MSKKINKIINVLLSALIPLGIILFIFYCARVFKGEFTVLTSDLNAQYSSYFTYFRNAVANGDSITYTFSKLIGGDTFSLLGYYMFSPLNLIVFLYPAAKVADAVFLIIVIKVSLAVAKGKKLYDKREDIAKRDAKRNIDRAIKAMNR